MANLAFGAPDTVTELMVAIDGIPGSYLTQRAYYHGLGLTVSDYIDIADTGRNFIFAEEASKSQVLHIPTWRMDLLPNGYFDLVICVQVLKEIPRRLLVRVIKEFARVLKPGGSVYIRDHLQFHNPNHMPVDELLKTSGFILEFQPHVRDRVEIHGVPRVWRKIDPELYFLATD